MDLDRRWLTTGRLLLGVYRVNEMRLLFGDEIAKMLSERGHPELRSLDALLYALGLRLAVTSSC
jgi:DNA-binding phage protein